MFKKITKYGDRIGIIFFIAIGLVGCFIGATVTKQLMNRKTYGELNNRLYKRYKRAISSRMDTTLISNKKIKRKVNKQINGYKDVVEDIDRVIVRRDSTTRSIRTYLISNDNKFVGFITSRNDNEVIGFQFGSIKKDTTQRIKRR